MTHYPVELTNVIYNPATQAFEARALVRDPNGPQSYACAVPAPITTEFDQAARYLVAQAERRHARRRPVAVLPQSRFAERRSHDMHDDWTPRAA